VSCSACFESIVSDCGDIVVRAGFPANYGLYWLVKKAGSNNIHQRLTTTNVNGDLVIFKSELPVGFMLTGRLFELQVKQGNDYLQPITFVFGGKQYTCIQASVNSFNSDEGDNSDVNVIQFKESVLPGSPSGSGNSIVHPFVNQTSITYNHNLGRIVDVSIFNLAGENIIATIDNSNLNYVIVTFTSPTTGRLLIQ
jgi:hypothetical protein